MSYQDQLHPWVVYRLLPNLQRLMVARFRRRGDADAYLKTMQRVMPRSHFAVVYEGRFT